MSFLMQLDENRVRMSAAGLFKVGKHLIPSVSSLLVALPTSQYWNWPSVGFGSIYFY